MEKIVRTSLYIDEKTYNEVKLYCVKHNIKTIKCFINDAIKEKLNKK